GRAGVAGTGAVTPGGRGVVAGSPVVLRGGGDGGVGQGGARGTEPRGAAASGSCPVDGGAGAALSGVLRRAASLLRAAGAFGRLRRGDPGAEPRRRARGGGRRLWARRHARARSPPAADAVPRGRDAAGGRDRGPGEPLKGRTPEPSSGVHRLQDPLRCGFPGGFAPWNTSRFFAI